MMIQSEATFNRADARAQQQDDEDSLFDSWLASLSTREFECILGGLAELDGTASLEASA